MKFFRCEKITDAIKFIKWKQANKNVFIIGLNKISELATCVLKRLKISIKNERKAITEVSSFLPTSI